MDIDVLREMVMRPSDKLAFSSVAELLQARGYAGQ
jgi:hypothetical protein